MVFKQLIPDTVNRAVTTLDDAAGKSINVAKVLQVLGAHPVAVGFLGGYRGNEIRTRLAALGVELDMVEVQSPTRQCLTLIDQATNAITECVEEGHAVPAEDYQRLLAVVRRRLPSCQAVVMSGTIPAGGPVDLYAQCLKLAHQSGALSVVDASGSPLQEALIMKPGLVKPNRSELQATLGGKLTSETDVVNAMQELTRRGAQRVVVTSGAQPTLAFDGHHAWRIHSPSVRTVNPIGSGDSFTAGLVWRLVQGDNLGDACCWASAAGAANALTLMTGDVPRQELDRLVSKVICEQIS
jgi:tagatose 6-phosphate kinase